MKHTLSMMMMGMILVLLCQCHNVDSKADRAKFRLADADKDGRLTIDEAQRFEHKRVFDLIDYDHSGSITLWEALDIAPEANRGKFNEYDLNGDGKVLFPEFEKIQIQKGSVKKRFDAADLDGDGFVTIQEADARIQFLQSQAAGEM